jgi:hypothetical protein
LGHMGIILSKKIAIPSILIIAFGGIPMFEISPVGAFIIWGIAILWFVGLIFYLPQRIKIGRIRSGVKHDTIMSDDLNPSFVSGFIQARHGTEILECKLIVAKSDKEYYMSSSGFSLQEVIGNTPRSFVFHIPRGDYLAVEGWDWGLVYVKTEGVISYTEPFPIRVFHDNEGQVITKKGTSKTRRLKDEGEITKQKLHELLAKASQPVKKSEKGKS